jgi:hypothetical protein
VRRQGHRFTPLRKIVTVLPEYTFGIGKILVFFFLFFCAESLPCAETLLTTPPPWVVFHSAASPGHMITVNPVVRMRRRRCCLDAFPSDLLSHNRAIARKFQTLTVRRDSSGVRADIWPAIFVFAARA